MNNLISKGIKKIKDSFVDSDEPINEENPEIELAMEKQGVFSFQNRELLNKYVDDFQLLHDHYFPTGVVGNWKDVSTANMDKVQFSVIAESGLTVDVILGGEDMFLHYSSQDDLDYLAKQLYSMIFRIIGMYDWQEVNYTGFLIKNHLNHAEILRAWHKDEDQLITLAQNLYMQHIVPRDVDDANQILHQKKITSRDKQTLSFFFKRVTEEISKRDKEEQKEIYQTLKSFKRCYEFLLQVSDLEDIELQKKYDFIIYLLKYMNINKPGEGYDLTNKVRAYNFNQKKPENLRITNTIPVQLLNCLLLIR